MGNAPGVSTKAGCVTVFGNMPAALLATDDLLRLASLVLRFGRVERTTFHEDGRTRETDTQHTVMLGLLACAFAERHAPGLDRGLVAQFALVHDLVEAYAGDTPMFALVTEADHQAKATREAAALSQIASSFDAAVPWLAATIRSYEALDTPEARLVKAMDKLLPKLTYLHNGGIDAYHAAPGYILREDFSAQRAKVEKWAGEWPAFIAAWDAVVAQMRACAPGGALPSVPTQEDAAALNALAGLSLRFGRILRATQHDDGARHESDADHTVMMGVVGCALASRVAPGCDRGTVAQMALVHDLVEVYAGDVNTFVGMPAEAQQQKHLREQAALERLEREFGRSLPWLTATIRAYEARTSPEARFVWCVDKLLPAVVNVLNDGSSIRLCFDRPLVEEDVRQLYGSIRARLAPASEEWPELVVHWDATLELVCKHFARQHA
jgi:putative hydrolase of HD superfamily